MFVQFYTCSSCSSTQSRWPLSNNLSEPSSIGSSRIPPTLDPKDSVPGAPIDPISRSLYPLSDELPSRPRSMSNTLISQEVTTPERHAKSFSPVGEHTDHSTHCLQTSMLPPSAPAVASYDTNDTPAVPGSWYGPGLTSLVSDAVDEYHASHTVNDVAQTPRRSISTTSLHNESLLKEPLTPHSAEACNVYHFEDRSLVELAHRSMSNLSLDDQAVKDSSEVQLSAGYVEDITAPDGQTFSAGVTFIKVWRMVNNGSCDWPNDTEVVFVGGAQLTNGNPLPHIQPMYPVGPLKPGQEKAVWTPELRAPDVPGRYTSYWRLRDGKGQLFGDSIWVDIEVVDPSQSEELVTSSSMIIMPNPTTSPASPAVDERTNSRSPTEESFDDYLSDSSSVSIVSVPSSEDETDTTLWEESRAQGPTTSTGSGVQANHVTEHTSTAMDYVLLYDDNTSEEE
ncbi:hypothetical protein C0993_011845 [Termitomyces sp. T159_Od127]|nr:hypothetical protein C0993_011845 [Termitomyces sp. T159_Od127]